MSENTYTHARIRQTAVGWALKDRKRGREKRTVGPLEDYMDQLRARTRQCSPHLTLGGKGGLAVRSTDSVVSYRDLNPGFWLLVV